MKNFYSNGKLLLTGEYLVLDGALSLAIPTQFGQSLTIKSIADPKLIWHSLDDKGDVWFEDEFLIDDMLDQVRHYDEISQLSRNDIDIAKILIQILNAAKLLNPEFLNTDNGYKVVTKMDFPKFWGLGSSSTLINNIAQWAKIDAYKLLELTFGGSGYDIACAQHNFPLTYQLHKGKRIVNQLDFNPDFKDALFFVHLNKKQNSRKAIDQYRTNKNNFSLAISEINDITSSLIICNSLLEFEQLIEAHELIISKIINQKPVKEQHFNNYAGAIKSLGAWGGDFVLATGTKKTISYFNNKGYNTIISYNDMILK